MICNRRRILCFSSFCFFFSIPFSFFFFPPYLPTKAENRQKNLSLPKKKSCLVISCQYIFIVFSFLFLGYVVMNCCKFVQFM